MTVLPVALSVKVDVSIPPETVFHIGPVPITNTMVSALITTLALIWLLRCVCFVFRVGGATTLVLRDSDFL